MNTSLTSAKNLVSADGFFKRIHTQPDWWAPVWKGLVFDAEGKHYRKLGSALWLLIYFILCANRQDGTLKRKVATISRETGVKTRTIRLWLDILRDAGYIQTQSSGRCLSVQICRWKSYPQWHLNVTQSDIGMSSRVTGLCHSRRVLKGPKISQLSGNLILNPEANDITIKKDIFKNDNVTSKERLLGRSLPFALDICQAFQDERNLPLYLSYIRKYPTDVIQKAYEETLKVPSKKIKKTRAALFNYLVQHYGKQQSDPQNDRH